MNRKLITRRTYKGQTMMVVGMLVATGVLIGFVALAFDGGSALLQRRAMQNAAEAGTLAGIELMQQNVLGTCDSKCYPTYLLTNAALIAQVNHFATANHGGTIGTANYGPVEIQYHYIEQTGDPAPAPCSNCYRTLTTATGFLPNFVDGLKVTAQVNNPSTFAKAFFPKENPNGISQLSISAVSAARLSPTCPVPAEANQTLPFVRFRPNLEREFTDGNHGNSLCNPFEFWQPNADIQGQSAFKNLISFNTNSLHPVIQRTEWTTPTPTPIVTSLLSGYDFRSNAGFDYRTKSGQADMRGHNPPTADPLDDVQNWLYWQWDGWLALGRTYNANAETMYQANRTNNWGQQGITTEREGDWVEILPLSGSLGNNVQQPLHDLAARIDDETPLSVALNWGGVVTRTVYVWGEPECNALPCDPNDHSYSDNKSVQEWRKDVYNRCGNYPGDPTISGWEDVTISEQSNGPGVGTFSAGDFCGGNDVSLGSTNPDKGDRLRVTYAYTFVFYANLQGTNYGAQDPPGCNLNLSGSAARGFLASPVLPGPEPGSTCGWRPGVGVYSRQVDPNDP